MFASFARCHDDATCFDNVALVMQPQWSISWSSGSNDDTAKQVPRSRCKHAACLFDGSIFIFGGKDGNIPLKDFWKYNIENDKWERLSLKGSILPSLQGHTMLSYEKKLWIFGGNFQFGADFDIPFWAVDVETNQCIRQCVCLPEAVPEPRRGHTAIIYKRMMFIFGGYVDPKGCNSDLWSYKFDLEKWTLLATEKNGGPSGRHGHSAVVYNDSMWIYGGLSGLTCRDDLWRWNLGLKQWGRIKSVQGPPPLEGHTACTLKKYMFLYGGNSKGKPVNDLWCYNFDSHVWAKVLHSGSNPTSHHAMVAVSSTLGQVLPSAKRSHSTPYCRSSFDSVHSLRNQPSRNSLQSVPGDWSSHREQETCGRRINCQDREDVNFNHGSFVAQESDIRSRSFNNIVDFDNSAYCCDNIGHGDAGHDCEDVLGRVVNGVGTSNCHIDNKSEGSGKENLSFVDEDSGSGLDHVFIEEDLCENRLDHVRAVSYLNFSNNRNGQTRDSGSEEVDGWVELTNIGRRENNLSRSTEVLLIEDLENLECSGEVNKSFSDEVSRKGSQLLPVDDGSSKGLPLLPVDDGSLNSLPLLPVDVREAWITVENDWCAGISDPITDHASITQTELFATNMRNIQPDISVYIIGGRQSSNAPNLEVKPISVDILEIRY